MTCPPRRGLWIAASGSAQRLNPNTTRVTFSRRKQPYVGRSSFRALSTRSAKHPRRSFIRGLQELFFVTLAASRIDALSIIFRRIDVRALVLRPPAGDETGGAGNSGFEIHAPARATSVNGGSTSMLNAAQPSDRALLSARESSVDGHGALSPGKVERRSFLKALGAAGAASPQARWRGPRRTRKKTARSPGATPRSCVSPPRPKSSKATSGCNTPNWAGFRATSSRSWQASLIPGYPNKADRRQRGLHQGPAGARHATCRSTSATTPRTSSPTRSSSIRISPSKARTG